MHIQHGEGMQDGCVILQAAGIDLLLAPLGQSARTGFRQQEDPRRTTADSRTFDLEWALG